MSMQNQSESGLSWKLIRRTFVAVAVLTVVLTTVALSASQWYDKWQVHCRVNAYLFIDAEIEGTEVYFRDQCLGTTPLYLSQSDCESAGIPVADGASFVTDGWGEGLPVYDPVADSHPRLMYKVPADHADAFLACETPWGLRTKTNGGWRYENGFRACFMKREEEEGLLTRIEIPAETRPGDKSAKVLVTVTHDGSQATTCCRPAIELHWGTFDVQWQNRSHQTYALPPEWSSIGPGDTRQTTLELPLPTEPGEYSLFATFDRFDDEQGKKLLGSTYSNSKLLRIR